MLLVREDQVLPLTIDHCPSRHDERVSPGVCMWHLCALLYRAHWWTCFAHVQL